MCAPRGGSFATLVLSIPLAAIPLMAIFGIPEFSPLSAASDEEQSDIVRRPSASQEGESHRKPTSTHDLRRGAADLFVPATASMTSTARGQESEAIPQAAQGAAQRRPNFNRNEAVVDRNPHQTPSPRPMQTAAIAPAEEQHVTDGRPAPLPATATGLTWREAARKLEQVGITDYRLERGHGTGDYLFACRFSPGSDPRIVQRFEAESSDPLDAVEQVLEQVDKWLQHRFAQSRAWISP